MSQPDVPPVLFHGTNSRRAGVIDHEGLRTRRKPRWPKDGNRRYIYLDEFPDAALMWGSKFRQDIKGIVYWVDVTMLDPGRLERDPVAFRLFPITSPPSTAGSEVAATSIGMWRYRGCIGPRALVRVKLARNSRTLVVAPHELERVTASLRA